VIRFPISFGKHPNKSCSTCVMCASVFVVCLRLLDMQGFVRGIAAKGCDYALQSATLTSYVRVEYIVCLTVSPQPSHICIYIYRERETNIHQSLCGHEN
jgi:hypothetical protein